MIFPITDSPDSKKTELNNVECFDVRWTTSKGKKGGNSRSTAKDAQALALKLYDLDATDISITRTWIAGYAF